MSKHSTCTSLDLTTENFPSIWQISLVGRWDAMAAKETSYAKARMTAAFTPQLAMRERERERVCVCVCQKSMRNQAAVSVMADFIRLLLCCLIASSPITLISALLHVLVSRRALAKNPMIRALVAAGRAGLNCDIPKLGETVSLFGRTGLSELNSECGIKAVKIFRNRHAATRYCRCIYIRLSQRCHFFIAYSLIGCCEDLGMVTDRHGY